VLGDIALMHQLIFDALSDDDFFDAVEDLPARSPLSSTSPTVVASSSVGAGAGSMLSRGLARGAVTSEQAAGRAVHRTATDIIMALLGALQLLRSLLSPLAYELLLSFFSVRFHGY
jgi:hypothetical protein